MSTNVHKPVEGLKPLATKEVAVPKDTVMDDRLKRQVNSLGMRFVELVKDGIQFSVWLTQVRDYAGYVRATGVEWEDAPFKQGPGHPAVKVSWEDARDFCKWMTQKERREGVIKPSHEYRLPTDLEWSQAVGLPKEDGLTPQERSGKIKNLYPWGKQWPPPWGAGNYAPILNVDDYDKTSPVGVFAPNAHGLYDMGGNVSEWCEDWYNTDNVHRVVRGASWRIYNQPFMLSSDRYYVLPNSRCGYIGFRCVLAPIPM